MKNPLTVVIEVENFPNGRNKSAPYFGIVRQVYSKKRVHVILIDHDTLRDNQKLSIEQRSKIVEKYTKGLRRSRREGANWCRAADPILDCTKRRKHGGFKV